MSLAAPLLDDARWYCVHTKPQNLIESSFCVIYFLESMRPYNGSVLGSLYDTTLH